MPSPQRRPATYADLLQVPGHLVAEILGGELHTSPRPAARHSLASSALGVHLGGRFQFGSRGPGGWWILDEPELHLGDDILVPDLAGWRKSRLPRVPDTAALTLVPDWICEVLSPRTARLDRVGKLAAYAGHGVQYAWLVDPRVRTLEVFQLDGETWRLLGVHEGGDRVRAEPFASLEIDLLSLWGEDRSAESGRGRSSGASERLGSTDAKQRSRPAESR